MLSYKEYKLLNETLGGPLTLGVRSGQTVGGVIGAQYIDPSELDDESLEEKKKNMGDGDKLEVDAETGDGEVVDSDDAPEKDSPDDSDGSSSDDSDDSDGTGSDDSEDCKFCKKMQKKHSKKKMKKEEVEWWESVESMLCSNPNVAYDDGFAKIKEDSLSPPQDPNQDLEDQPKPDQYGFSQVGVLTQGVRQ